MGRVPRSLLLLAVCALALSGCAHRSERVERVVIGYQLCEDGCRSFTTSFSKDGSSASPAFEWSGAGGDARPIISRALGALPLEAIQHCQGQAGATNDNRALVGVHFGDGTDKFCTIRADGAPDASDAGRVRRYVATYGWSIYRATLQGQYDTLASAVPSGAIRRLTLRLTARSGRSTSLEARFDANGDAIVRRLDTRRPVTTRMRVRFDEITGTLARCGIRDLQPSYPLLSGAGHGVTIEIQLPRDRFFIRGGDDRSWNPAMRCLVSGLSGIAGEHARP